jgi:hypothetical protein
LHKRRTIRILYFICNRINVSASTPNAVSNIIAVFSVTGRSVR